MQRICVNMIAMTIIIIIIIIMMMIIIIILHVHYLYIMFQNRITIVSQKGM